VQVRKKISAALGACTRPAPPTTSSTDETSDRDQQHRQDFVAQKLDPKIHATRLLHQPINHQPRWPCELIGRVGHHNSARDGDQFGLAWPDDSTVPQNVYDTVSGNFLLVPSGDQKCWVSTTTTE
jgi:hypothetical protein